MPEPCAADISIDAPPESIVHLSRTLRLAGPLPRVRALFLLAERPRLLADLRDALALSEPMADYHVAQLRHAGLVASVRGANPRGRGSQARYSLTARGRRFHAALVALLGEEGGPL